MTDDVLSKVQKIFGELFDIDPHMVSLQTRATDIPKWDSVGHLSLCGALEETFDVRFNVSELAEMTSVFTIVSIIDEKKALMRQTNN